MTLDEAKRIGANIMDQYQRETGFDPLDVEAIEKAESVEAVRDVIRYNIRWLRYWVEGVLCPLEKQLSERFPSIHESCPPS